MVKPVCPICQSTEIDYKVQLIYKNRIEKELDSYLKIEKYAIDYFCTPAVARYVYRCRKCFHEDNKGERFIEKWIPSDDPLLWRK